MDFNGNIIGADNCMSEAIKNLSDYLHGLLLEIASNFTHSLSSGECFHIACATGSNTLWRSLHTPHESQVGMLSYT